jgi:lysophospholipid acyltransferase (LPLAT)-like uncharacterized protein
VNGTGAARALSPLSRAARVVLGAVLGAVVWAWTRTLRVVVEESPALLPASPRIVAFQHGQQLALLSVPRRRRTAVLVSLSADGELQAGVMRALGMVVVRGSSSRRAAGSLARVVKLVRRGLDAAFAVDGPRGPAGVAKPGAALAARAAGALLVPVASAMRRGGVLSRAWDRFELPLPFSRVAVVIGAPVDAGAAVDRPALLDEALAAVRSRAVDLARSTRQRAVAPRDTLGAT